MDFRRTVVLFTTVILFAIVNMSVLFSICAVAVGATSAHRQSPWLTISVSKSITVIRFSVNPISQHYMLRTTHLGKIA